MEYRIEDRGEFEVIGKAERITCRDGENFRRIPQFWDECCSDGTYEKMLSKAKGNTTFGICMDMELEKEQFSYMVAGEYDGSSPKDGLTVRKIPASTWAVFTSRGPLPGSIQRVTEKIFQEWFPATGYEHADAPELEVYLEGDTKSEDYECEVWIPVVKK